MCEMITKSGTSCKEDHREVMQEKGHVKKEEGHVSRKMADALRPGKRMRRIQNTMWKASCNRGIRNVGLMVEDLQDKIEEKNRTILASRRS